MTTVRVFEKLGLVMLLGAAMLCPAGPVRAAPTPEPAARGSARRVDPVVGGYRVTLKLADPLSATSDKLS